MKVTQVSIIPTQASQDAGRPQLTPELLAAVGAKYSRSNLGLQEILNSIDPDDLEGSVDRIFKNIDYGHQSILDMVPVAMFLDEISIFLAQQIFYLSPTAGGQESSTRYIKMSDNKLINPETLGIPQPLQNEWTSAMRNCFASYHKALTFWADILDANPELIVYPEQFRDDSPKSIKARKRIKKNYRFDRARYFLPVATATNMMLSMSARGWLKLCINLLSSPLVEANAVGEAILEELKLVAPRTLKHAVKTYSYAQGIKSEFLEFSQLAQHNSKPFDSIEGEPFLSISYPPAFKTPYSFKNAQEFSNELTISTALKFHDNRYSWIGHELKRISVCFGWNGIAFADIRDLARHRTGNKFLTLIPRGFYFAKEQIPDIQIEEETSLSKVCSTEEALIGYLETLAKANQDASLQAFKFLCDYEDNPFYVYWASLGTTFDFEHLTTGDNFVYEAELRTGVGAHFRYAKHLHDSLALWYKETATRGLILEGHAEPE